MTMIELTKDELQLEEAYYPVVNKWLARGDGVAVYENMDLGHHELGHRKFVSFGSPAAQLEMETPPQRLPDMGSAINWRYQLVGVYTGEAL